MNLWLAGLLGFAVLFAVMIGMCFWKE